MKHLYCVFIFLVLSSFSIAQQHIKRDFKQNYPYLLSNDKTAEWPSKSFYERKGEWQQIIDSTWGFGLEVSEKRQVFNKYADFVERNFALFHCLDCDWDSLRAYWYDQITDNTSKGGFSAILSHLSYNLKDGHSRAWDTDIGGYWFEKEATKLNPGIPILVFACIFTLDASHFGASLTTNDNEEIFVIRSVDSHPLGLEPGDEILGYEGVKWIDLVNELINSHIPIIGALPTTKEARIHNTLISAGINWHLFNTIDIVKHSIDDTLHLSLEPMIQFETDKMTFAEQLDIPGVPLPNYPTTWEPVSYGKIENSSIGMIYIHGHERTDITPVSTNDIFYDAITNLFDTDGLIIDLRFDNGGWGDQHLNQGLNLLSNGLIDVIRGVERCDISNLITLCDLTFNWHEIFKLDSDPNTFYDKPIAVLVGPGCFSMGDITATRLRALPNLRFFGKTTGGGFGALGEPTVNGFFFNCQIEDMYHPNSPHEYLSGTLFPVDEKVWLTKDDVAIGEDTVVKEAMKWITNLSHTYNTVIDKTYSLEEVSFSANVYNPNKHELSITAYIANELEVTDSIDCEIANEKIKEIIDVSPYPEDFYSISIFTEDLVDSATHTLPNIVRYTNVGPIDIIDFEISQVSNINKLRISNVEIINNSLTKTIPNIKINFTSPDSSVRSIAGAVSFGDLPAQGTQLKTGRYYVDLDTLTDNTSYTFIAEISSESIVYWKDTIEYVHVPVGIELAENLPTEYNLSQNYPNPFNPSTSIKYSIPNQSNVTLKVFDVLGSEIATLVNQEQSQGNYEIEFDGSDLTSGIYFYRLQAGEFVETKKMILIK